MLSVSLGSIISNGWLSLWEDYQQHWGLRSICLWGLSVSVEVSMKGLLISKGINKVQKFVLKFYHSIVYFPDEKIVGIQFWWRHSFKYILRDEQIYRNSVFWWRYCFRNIVWNVKIYRNPVFDGYSFRNILSDEKLYRNPVFNEDILLGIAFQMRSYTGIQYFMKIFF